MEEARRARPGTRGAQPPLGSTASCALAHGSAPRGPERPVAADGAKEAPGRLGPLSRAASPSPYPALPSRLRGPGRFPPSAAAPRRTGRPGGRWLPQRPPGSRGTARFGAGREGAGPARREGAFKATHTPPSARSRAREPGGSRHPRVPEGLDAGGAGGGLAWLPLAAWGARSPGLDSKFPLLPFTQSLGPPSPTAVCPGLPLQSLSLLCHHSSPQTAPNLVSVQ